MAVQHDFKKFPELTNAQLQLFQFRSPHKQITEDFICDVVHVTDGDTIRVEWSQRDFDFPIRFVGSDAPEMNEEGGKESQKWLEGRILNERVMVHINKANRVDKWGRLLGTIYSRGLNMSNASIWSGHAVPFGQREEGKIPEFRKETGGIERAP